MSDPINHPSHYTSHPSGVECITVTEHMGFNLGNAVKYIWRADEKGHALEDLQKARWYIVREIARREAMAPAPVVDAAYNCSINAHAWRGDGFCEMCGAQNAEPTPKGDPYSIVSYPHHNERRLLR